MTDIELGWTAGIIDGEGCIGIYNYGHTQDALTIQVGTTSRATAEKLLSLWGGSIARPKVKTKGGRTKYNWCVRCRKAADVLEQVEKHLIEKWEQASVGLLFAGTRVHHGKRLEPKVKEFRIELAQQLRDMKKCV